MLYTRWLASGTEEEFHWQASPGRDAPVLITMSPAQAHGNFKSITHTSATTGIIVQPKPGLSIWVTDIIMTGTKDNTNTAKIQFADGTDTVIILDVALSTTPPNISTNLQTYFRGWKDARIELITSGTNSTTVTVAYIHSTQDPSFSEWNTERG